MCAGDNLGVDTRRLYKHSSPHRRGSDTGESRIDGILVWASRQSIVAIRLRLLRVPAGFFIQLLQSIQQWHGAKVFKEVMCLAT